jgi:hypothetical protein
MDALIPPVTYEREWAVKVRTTSEQFVSHKRLGLYMRISRAIRQVVRKLLHESSARHPWGQFRGVVARSLTPHVRRALWRYRSRRWRQIGDLRGYEWQRYSQNGEDGILAELLHRVGVQSRFFVEFGVETGAECNCARLVWEERWCGLFMEGDRDMAARLAARYRKVPGVQCAHEWITADDIEAILAKHAVPEDLDVLSIDIDGNDYWVWRAIQRWHPRIVVIEYNASVRPPRQWIMPENPKHVWNYTTWMGASLAALAAVGRQKQYTLVATDSTGTNAFFVRDDLFNYEQFLDPAVLYHYSPARYSWRLSGHGPPPEPMGKQSR